MKTTFFIRHGASESDVGNVRVREFHDDMYTQMDWPLSDKGRAQAVRVAEKLRSLNVELVLSSSLCRAVETAEIAARESGIPYGGGWEELNEVVMGRVPGATVPAADRRPRRNPLRRFKRPLWPLLHRGLTVSYLLLWRVGKTEGGETREQVEGRVREVLRRMAGLPQERIALVGHGYWILFLARVLQRSGGRRLPPFPPGGWVSNGSFTRVCESGNGWELDRFAVPLEKADR